MDELIQQLDHLTKDRLGRLHESPYEELESFVEERQKLVESIAALLETCQLKSEQKLVIRGILEQDSVILTRMNTLRLEAQEWLQKRNQAKVQRNAYESGYAPDSILMDRKK